MRGHVDTGSRYRDRRATSKMIQRSSLLSKSLRNFDDTLVLEPKITGVTEDEVGSIGSSSSDIGICGRVHSLGYSC